MQVNCLKIRRGFVFEFERGVWYSFFAFQTPLNIYVFSRTPLDVLAHTVGMKIEVFVGKRCFLRSLLSELVKAAV